MLLLVIKDGDFPPNYKLSISSSGLGDFFFFGAGVRQGPCRANVGNGPVPPGTGCGF